MERVSFCVCFCQLRWQKYTQKEKITMLPQAKTLSSKSPFKLSLPAPDGSSQMH